MTTEDPTAVEYRRGSHIGAARTLVELLRSDLPPVLSWEITPSGTLRGQLAESCDPVESIRAVHRRYGGTVCSRKQDGRRQLCARLTLRLWSVDLWVWNPQPPS